MQVIFDIEANGLESPTEIWLIVCKDIETGEYHVFRNLTRDQDAKERFITFANDVSLWIGHNCIGYDFVVLSNLIGFKGSGSATIRDTLILSKLIDYSRDGHSIDQYGFEFNLPKGDFKDFSRYSKEMEVYCVRDVDICHKIYLKYLRYLSNPNHIPSIELEHYFQSVVNDLHNNGFAFNTPKARTLLEKVSTELSKLDKEIASAFPNKLRPVREIYPKYTVHGTLHRGDFRWCEGGDLAEYNGGPFTRCRWESFNPSSHKQIIDILHHAGWKPTDKTDTAKDNERLINQLKYKKNRDNELDTRLKACYAKEQSLVRYGWKINEANLSTLPLTAPASARTLASRILLESRRRTLTEWLGLVDTSNRIHGKFYGIGAWTHRMAHQNPNTANIPTEKKLFGDEMRSLWQAAKGRLLVGVDAEGIQLRIFAHYINDPEFIKEVTEGDPHDLNRRVIGTSCKTRDAAKRFIFAYLLGAGTGKLGEILGAGSSETKSIGEAALNNLLERYRGLQDLKEKNIPKDAGRGWFVGLDGRRVAIYGETVGLRRHLCMSGYLQNGESVVMKWATRRWHERLDADPDIPKGCWRLVNMVHDEWQTEVPNDVTLGLRIAKHQADSLREVGELLKLNCPLSGSFWSKRYKDNTIGTNWKVTH